MEITTSDNTLFCDKCGRPIGSKGYIDISGWKICGVCQWEAQQKNNPILPTQDPPYPLGIPGRWLCGR